MLALKSFLCEIFSLFIYLFVFFALFLWQQWNLLSTMKSHRSPRVAVWWTVKKFPRWTFTFQSHKISENKHKQPFLSTIERVVESLERLSSLLKLIKTWKRELILVFAGLQQNRFLIYLSDSWEIWMKWKKIFETVVCKILYFENE